MIPGRLLAVPNFSEGRDPAFLGALREAASAATVHTIASDVDHNRTVAGLSGDRTDLEAPLLAMADIAFARIDLTRHQGVHPRIGALDVLPIVPTVPDAEQEAHDLVARLSAEIAARGVPVFLYGRSGTRELPALRKGQFEGWVGKELEGEHAPDSGPSRLHPTLGGTVHGVRGPLIAFNIDLTDPDPTLAKQIAKEMRAESAGRLPGIRALGVPLASRGLSQVSCNITEPDKMGIRDVYEFVKERAGDSVDSCEVIGVIRRKDLTATAEMRVRCLSEQVLDY